MGYLYSLYDALISIKVPNDKARAVVDAMERDMATTIATKSALQLLRHELMSGIFLLATKDEMQVVRSDIAELRQDNALIRKDMEIMANRIDNRIDGLSTTMTVRLGSMLVVGIGLLFAALKLASMYWATFDVAAP